MTLLKGWDSINGGVLEIADNGGTQGTVANFNGFLQIATGATLYWNSSASRTMGTLISMAGGVTVNKGTLTLTAANTYTGPTTITGGSLVLDKSGTGALAANSALTLAGTFTIKGKTTGTTTQTLGNLTLNGGAGTLVLNPNNGAELTLTLGNAWTRTTGSTLLLDYSSANTGTRQVVTAAATTGVVLSNGMYGAVLVKDTAGITGFGTRAAGTNIAITRYDDTTGTSLAEASDDLTINFTTLGTTYTDGTLNWTNGDTLANRALNSLTIDTTANSGTIDMGAASNILTLASKAILCKGDNDETLTGGQIGATNSEVIVHQTGTGTLTIRSLVSSGTGSLTKDGAGTLSLDSGQGYTGPTTVSDGTLQIAGSGALNGGAYAGAITIASAATFTYHSSVPQSLGGVISGTGALIQMGAGTLTLSGPSTYTGPTSITAGTLKAGIAAVTNVSGAFGLNSAVSLANNADAALDITGYDTQIGSLTGGGTAGGNITLGAATLSVGGDNTSPASYDGVISGSTGALTKSGSGTLTLGGSNTYGGLTTISGGTLRLGNGGDTLADSAPVMVNGGTLDVANNDTVGTLTLASGTISGSGILSGSSYALTNTGTISAVLGGSGALVKSGTGTTTLAAVNTYTNDTTVEAGTLSVSTASFDDASTVTIGKVTGASAILTLNTAGATDTVNKLFIDGEQMPAGTYGSTASAAEHQDNTAFGSTGTGILNVLTNPGGTPDYDSWKSSYSGDMTSNGDPDGDGMTNQQEYAFGLNPNNGTSANPIQVPFDKTTGTFSYTRRDPTLTGMTYKVLTSTSLLTSSWVEDSDAISTPGTVGGDGTQTVAVKLNPGLLDRPRLFIRVEATQP